VALLDEIETTWRLAVQKDGEPFPTTDAEQILSDLQPFFRDAFIKSSLLIASTESETNGSRIPGSIKKLGIERLFLMPMTTVSRRLGMVVVGRKAGETFSRDDQSLLLTIAEHLAISIENLRLHKSLQRHFQQLQRQNELILHAAGEGIYGLDAEGKTTFVNPAAAKLLGCEPDELIGRSMHALLHHTKSDGSPYPPEECPIYAAFKDGQVHRVDDEVFWRKDGSSFPVEYTSTPIREQGELAGAVVVFWDISKRRRAEDALQKAHGDLANALSEVENLKNRLQAENVYLQEEIKLEHNFEEIVSQSEALKKELRKLEQVATTDATVLILGETGTGKELLARAVHNLSPRRDRPLVKVNCAALPADLIESELFGHEKGAFTGAHARKIGRFELADGGTIFLDEIGDLPLALQAKLLRVLQEGEFERLGNPHTIKVDVRIIAATNRDLEKAIESGDFRGDLYYRLNVFPIKSPPLRERQEDIPLLVAHFVKKYGAKLGKNIEIIPQKVMDILLAYAWPGNVRELENIIERAVILARGFTIELDESLDVLRDTDLPNTNSLTLEEVE
jgi:PAS domain S-box-containing protein